MLRDGALSDKRVIAMINEYFVPVWINVRETAVPQFSGRDEVLVEAAIRPDGRIDNVYSKGFFLRSVVLTPDGATLLNPQASTITGSAETLTDTGHFAYAQFEPRDYIPMLEDALLAYVDHKRRADPPALAQHGSE